MASAPVEQALAPALDAAPAVPGPGARWYADRRLPWLALAAVIAGGLAQTAVRYHDYHLGFLSEEFDFLLKRDTITFHTLLQPHNENLSTVGVLLYRALFALFGLSTVVPYVALLLLSLAACAALTYVFVRREVGPWLGLIAPLLLVTLGPAAEGVLWPFMFTLYSSLAFWLGGMLLIERDERASDAAGCALLLLSVGSMSIGVLLLPATALALVLRRGWRRALRGAWIVAVPLVLYLAWYAAYRPHTEDLPEKVPGFIVNSFVATVSDLTGITSSTYTVPLAALLIAAVCARCLYLRRVPATTLYMGFGLVLVWAAGGLNENPSGLPAESRYQVHNCVLLLIALAPLVPRLHARRRGRSRAAIGVLVVGVVAVIVASNLGRYGLYEEYNSFRESEVGAELAALEVARPAVLAPTRMFESPNETPEWQQFTPQAYYSALDAHGSPLRIRSDLELAPPIARYWADFVLVHLEGIGLFTGHIAAGTTRPQGAGLLPAGPSCSRIAAGAASSGLSVSSPPGGLTIRPDAGASVSVGAERFSSGASPGIMIGTVPGATEASIITRRDASNIPWRFRLTAAQAVTVCSVVE